MTQEINIAIIAASSAILGSVISQVTAFAISFFDKKHKKDVHLRQKYEEMMFFFSASLAWIPQVNSCTTPSQIASCAQSPDSRKALSLCLLYFPDLSESATGYVQAQEAYYISVADNYNKAVPASAGEQAFSNPSHGKVVTSYFEKRNKFEKLIIDLSNSYVKV
jgi:hypothetical protein